MTVSAPYDWLDRETAPKLLMEMLKLYGVAEKPGTLDEPTIMAWAEEVGLRSVYLHDSVPWCGLTVAVAAKRAGKTVPADPLWALNWGSYGVDAGVPMLGDVLVFRRDGGGHVGVYVGEDDEAYHVLGGNQSDRVCITRIARSRLYRARRTAWAVAQPRTVRRVRLAASGALSKNES